MLEFWQNASSLTKFLIRAGVLYLLWNVSYYGFMKDSVIDTTLSANVAKNSAVLLRAFDYEGTYTYNEGNAFVGIGNSTGVIIGHPCNGLVLYALFAGFIIAYAGDWKLKLVIIPIGIAVIYFINVVRCALLAIDFIYHENSFELNHKFTYTIAVYAFVFALWMLWANKLSELKLGTQKAV